jgi:Myb/SANT-like DNA-binding domain
MLITCHVFKYWSSFMDRFGKTLVKVTKRRKQKSSGPAENIKSFQTRSANWGKEETNLLLNAAQEIQSNNTKTNLNFTKHELQQVHAFFSTRTKEISRTSEQLNNIIKIFKKEYNIFRELTTKSGWGWDYDNHVLVLPTTEILRELCQVYKHIK